MSNRIRPKRGYKNYNRTIKATAARLAKPPAEPRAKKPGRPRHERRLANRLSRIPANRTCPKCRKVEIDHRKWFLPQRASARCLSCRRKELASNQPRKGRSRSERRLEARMALLPNDRICPTCGECVPEARRWAVTGGAVVECLRCRRSR